MLVSESRDIGCKDQAGLLMNVGNVTATAGLQPNTVHFNILMRCAASTRTLLSLWRRRAGILLCCRRTPRGRRNPRLDTTRTCRISSITASWNAFRCRGGNIAVEGQLAASYSDRLDERDPVPALVFAGLQRRLVHPPSYGKVRQQQP